MVPILLCLMLCVGAFSMQEINTTALGECEQQLCVLQKDLLTLKTLIATQNTQIANQDVQIERQNTKIAEQNTRMLEEVIKANQLRATVSGLKEMNNQLQMKIEILNQNIDGRKECPHGWERHIEMCYLIVDNETKSWADARDKCKGYGGDLAIIEGESTNNFLKEMSRRSKARYIWFGGNDMKTEGTWIWDKTGDPVRFTDWNRGQPDNYRSRQDCTAFHRNFNFKWDDGTCSSSQNYICQLAL